MTLLNARINTTPAFIAANIQNAEAFKSCIES